MHSSALAFLRDSEGSETMSSDGEHPSAVSGTSAVAVGKLVEVPAPVGQSERLSPALKGSAPESVASRGNGFQSASPSLSVK